MNLKAISLGLAAAMSVGLAATLAEARELNSRQPFAPSGTFVQDAQMQQENMTSISTSEFWPGKAAADVRLTTTNSTAAQATAMLASAPRQYFRRGYRRSYWRPRAYYSYPRSTYGYPYANFYTVPSYPGYPGFYGGNVYFVPYNGIYYRRW